MTTITNPTRGTPLSLREMALIGLRYLSTRKLRTTLTTLAIVLGVAMIFLVNLILPTLSKAFKQTLQPIAGVDARVISASGQAFTPEAVLAKISQVDQVGAVTGILRRTISIPTLKTDKTLAETPQITLTGIDPATVEAVHPFVVTEGRMLTAEDKGKVLIPAGLAELAPSLKLGTTFPLVTAGGLKFYTVVGFIAEQGTPSAPEVYMTLADAQAAFTQPGLINTVEISMKPGADIAVVNSAIQQAVGTEYTLNETNATSNTLGSMQVGFAMFNLLGFLSLLLGAFLIFNTFRTVVVERRRDLGLLRAIGATQRQITMMILVESLIQGVIGTIIGLILGYVMAILSVSLLNQLWSSYFHRGIIRLEFDVVALIMAVSMGLLASLLAGYLPARMASRTSPLEALRPATSTSVNRTARRSLIIGVVVMVIAVLMLFAGSKTAVTGALLFLIGMIVAAPGLVLPMARLFSPLLTLWFAREGDLARGNLTRQPGRAAITGSTLMIGLATLVMIAALVASMETLITSLGSANFSSDIMLLPQSIGVYDNVVGANEELANKLRALPEVDAIGTIRYSTSTINNQAIQVLAIDPTQYPKVASLVFSQGQSSEAFTALGNGRNAILTSMALSTLNLNVGDNFTLETAEGPQQYRIAGVANDLFTFKVVTLFISQANMASDFHKTEDIILMLKLKPNVDVAATMPAVEKIVEGYPQFTVNQTTSYRHMMESVSNSAMSIFYVLALVILVPAALGLLNTLTINVLERTREIGVVRAVGGSRQQVQRMVTAESLLLGLFGAAMGILAGIVMSYGFIKAFSIVGWDMPYYFPVIGIIAAVVVGLLLALFAAILPARNVAKLDIIRALQYE